MLAIFIEINFGKQIIERLPIEYRKTKSKIINLPSHKEHRQSAKPDKIHSAGKGLRVSHDWFRSHF